MTAFTEAACKDAYWGCFAYVLPQELAIGCLWEHDHRGLGRWTSICHCLLTENLRPFPSLPYSLPPIPAPGHSFDSLSLFSVFHIYSLRVFAYQRRNGLQKGPDGLRSLPGTVRHFISLCAVEGCWHRIYCHFWHLNHSPPLPDDNELSMLDNSVRHQGLSKSAANWLLHELFNVEKHLSAHAEGLDWAGRLWPAICPYKDHNACMIQITTPIIGMAPILTCSAGANVGTALSSWFEHLIRNEEIY